MLCISLRSAGGSTVFGGGLGFLVSSVVLLCWLMLFPSGAGKTYTMLGRDDHPGIMAHALSELFTQMKRGKDDHVYKVTMSYLEVPFINPV